MNRQFPFATDTAALALFDPERLRHRANDDADWWSADPGDLDEVRSGALALVNLGGDGIYRVRITDGGDLTPNERDYAASAVRGLGIEIVSGRMFVGPAECLPGGGSDFTAQEARRGVLLDVASGLYDVDVLGIDWRNSPRWWHDEDTVPDAPPDLVLLLRPRSAPFAAPKNEPRLDLSSGSFLYESSTRRIGPEPGMILTAKVRRGPSNELVLQECGPCSYRATLVDDSMVAWKDTVRFKVLKVDHAAKQVTGEFLERVEGLR